MQKVANETQTYKRLNELPLSLLIIKKAFRIVQVRHFFISSPTFKPLERHKLVLAHTALLHFEIFYCFKNR